MLLKQRKQTLRWGKSCRGVYVGRVVWEKTVVRVWKPAAYQKFQLHRWSVLCHWSKWFKLMVPQFLHLLNGIIMGPTVVWGKSDCIGLHKSTNAVRVGRAMWMLTLFILCPFVNGAERVKSNSYKPLSSDASFLPSTPSMPALTTTSPDSQQSEKWNQWFARNQISEFCVKYRMPVALKGDLSSWIYML